MKTPRSVRNPTHSATDSVRRTGTRLRILRGAAAAVSILIVSLAGVTPLAAHPAAAADQGKGKRYKATRAFVVDKQTGDVRLPTQQEVDEVVANLSALGQRPAESLQQSPQANGAVGLNLDGGFGGVLLAQPNGDGTWQTKCVFTLEEGTEFLGIVEDDSSR